MAIKKYKPRTPGLRTKVTIKMDTQEGNDSKKVINGARQLKTRLKSHSGRNNQGKITMRSRGGGVKRLYRQIDFKRNKEGVPGIIRSVEYDPYRSANIALVFYKDGEKRYIVAPKGAKIGQEIVNSKDADIVTGNTMEIGNVPSGTIIHNIELTPGKGAQLARSAGAYATITAKSDRYVTVKLPSGEVRLIFHRCLVTIGQVGNGEWRNRVIGNAGTKRKLGRRPDMRGAAMNAVDHPHGGGEGKAPCGKDAPRTPWGKRTMGVRTSRKVNKHVVSRRKGRR